VSQAVVRFTEPVLKPLRSALPRSRFHDWSALLVLVLLQLLATTLLSLITTGATLPPQLLLFSSLFQLLYMATEFFFWLIVISIVLSWISPGHHPVTVLMHQLAEPVLAPFRRLLPSMGGLDLSPILAFLAIQVVQILLRSAAGSISGML
jgi:YggT family protein